MIIGRNCKPEIQRIRYKKGQLFASRDLRDDSDIAATLRWLHNRALHDVYGVNDGMIVTRVDEYGNPVQEDADFVALVISEGLAYDCFGRELILQKPRHIPLPSVPSNGKSLTLLIRYKDTATFFEKDAIQGNCLPGELSSLSEQPEFFWKPDSLVELVDGVPLTRIKYDEKGVPELSEEEFQVPISRPLAKPRIASGATIPGNTAWEVWTESAGESEYTVGVQTKIDTSAEGFTKTPCYFASLQGFIEINSERFFISGFQHVTDPSINGFTFRLLYPLIRSPFSPVSSKFSVRKEFTGRQYTNFQQILALFKRGNIEVPYLDLKNMVYVSWFGIQPQERVNEASDMNAK